MPKKIISGYIRVSAESNVDEDACEDAQKKSMFIIATTLQELADNISAKLDPEHFHVEFDIITGVKDAE